MKKSTALRTAIVTAVATAGLAAGGIAIATADPTTSPKPGVSSKSKAPDRADTNGQHRPGRGGAFRDAGDLAEALGVSESKLKTALGAVREELKPADRDRDDRPTKAERQQRRAEFASALADELGISEQQVTAALDKVQSEHAAEHRAKLSNRLDKAVEAGDLTEADRESVLKAYDAGVLGMRR
jgi:hypothetical protein